MLSVVPALADSGARLHRRPGRGQGSAVDRIGQRPSLLVLRMCNSETNVSQPYALAAHQKLVFIFGENNGLLTAEYLY